MHVHAPTQLAVRLKRYVRAQPYPTSSSLLIALVPGHPAISNHPELLGGDRPDDGETASAQDRENARGHALLTGATGKRTVEVPDLGAARIDERFVKAVGVRVRLAAGESLIEVARAQHAVARTFLIAGAIGLALVLIASYLAGALFSRPLRRLAHVAARVDDGDLHPRMHVSPSASREVRVLADAFNHMLDRLSVAFDHQRDFVADASHELRTPLTVIAGQLEVLAATQDPSPDDIQRVQRLVGNEVARTSRLVDDMLLLIRSEHEDFLRPTAIDLPSWIDDLWTTTTNAHDRRLQLEPGPEATLDADPDRLAQALRNLIDNALAHTRAPTGLISLLVEPLPDSRVRLTVSDDGPGIPDAQRERVFERFHRTDTSRARSSGGAGLGLSIVRAIAEAHGGTVRARERPGGGAQIELELPGYHRRAHDPDHHSRRHARAAG
jgi:signal transduction histidine kinase